MMRDATRRNRNIGTSKQGHGQNNKLTISSPALILKSFFELLNNYEKISKTINGHDFLFIIEKTRKSSTHACSISDIENILKHIPISDIGELKLVIFRQPKRKEEILNPVWGRLIYNYEFENDIYPAIIIEAVDYQKKYKRTKKLNVDNQKEFERLKADGHKFKDMQRYYQADYELKNVRNTQLYRTLLHEIGHYVQYLDFVERPGNEDEEFEEWEKRYELYFKIPASEKEKFAHSYSDKMRKELIDKKVIPFDRID